MNIIELIIAIVLTSLGAVFLGYLLWLIIPQLRPFVGMLFSAFQLKKARAHFDNIDSLIASGQIEAAIKELRESPMLTTVKTRSQLEQIKDHHQNLLSRLLVVSEELQKPLDAALADCEHLFSERVEILSLFIKANESYTRIAEKRGSSGKRLPNWSKEDFSRRAKDILEELERNKKDLNSALETVFSILEKPSSDTIVYH